MFKHLFSKRSYLTYFFMNYNYDWDINDQVVREIQADSVQNIMNLNYYIYDDDRYRTQKGLLKNFNTNGRKIISIVFNQSQESDSVININLGYPQGFNSFIITFPTEKVLDYNQILGLLGKINFKIDYGYSIESSTIYASSYLLGQSDKGCKIFDVIKIGDHNLQQWKMNHKKILNGEIRDIYKVNFLSKVQFDKITNIYGSLEKLIERDKKFGSVDFKNEYIIWKVENDNLNFVREFFMEIMVT